MLDLSLTTSVYFPALVGFFMLIVKPGPTVPATFGVAASTGSAAIAPIASGEQNCGGALSHDPPRMSFQTRRG